MNGLNRITDRLLADAQSEIDATILAAQTEADAIRARYEQQARREREEILARGRKRAGEHKERLAGAAQLEARKMVLTAKQSMLDRAYDMAKEELAKLPEKQTIALLAMLAATGSSSGKEAIILSQKDHKTIGDAVVTAANKALAEKKRPANLVLSPETRNIFGGLLLTDGEVETNCTFESLLRLTKGEIIADAANVLFA
ncbi:MAG: V-type ATP synthase subunit E [Evtepia sp.]